MTAFIRLLLCACIIMLATSCKKNTPLTDTTLPYQHKTDSLIAKGKQLQNTHIDSLQAISQQLNNISEHGDKRALVYSELFTAQYYWLSSNHQKSMEAAIKCLADAEKYNIKAIYPNIYITIANLHKENGNYKMAFEADDKGLVWAKINKDTSGIIALLSLKAMFIHSYHLFLHDPNLKDTSINLQFSALAMAESSPKFEAMRIRFYDNIAQYYLDNKDYANTIFYGDKGVELAIKYNQQRSLTYSYCWLGQAWYFKGDKAKGLAYLNKALIISRSLNEPYRTMEIYGHLYSCYYFSGAYKEAIALQNISRKMHDSLQVSKNEKEISELQIKYESVKKDKELVMMGHDQTVKNRLIIAVLGGSMLFIAFSVILFLQYRVISRNNRIISLSNDKKGKALQNIAHIQAHELRKPLASIMGLINVIKIMDYEYDKECVLKLEESCKELDDKIHTVLSHVDKQSN